jgi:hypothetical protein
MINFDFHPDHIDPVKFLQCEEARQLVNGEFFNVNNMTNDELMQSIIDDVLAVTIWEIQTGLTLCFDVSELTRFLTLSQKLRIASLLKNDELNKCLEYKDAQIRIKTDPYTLKSAMECAGVSYNNYALLGPVVKVNREEFKRLDFNDLAKSIAMDLESTCCVQQMKYN